MTETEPDSKQDKSLTLLVYFFRCVLRCDEVIFQVLLINISIASGIPATVPRQPAFVSMSGVPDKYNDVDVFHFPYTVSPGTFAGALDADRSSMMSPL